MAITIEETFQVNAPVEDVWAFLLDPQQVVTCMPGAGLDEVVDERTFLGTIRVKVGPIVANYKGRVEFVDVDASAHRIQMSAEGRETGGSGNARATMESRLTGLSSGGTQVVAEARADVTGRVMQFGQGMIEGVSHQLFLDFVKRVKERLEAAPGSAAAPAPARPSGEPEAISIVAIVLRAIWAWVQGLARRVFRIFRRGSPAS